MRELPGVLALLGYLLVGFDLVNGLAPMRAAAALAHGRSVLGLEHAVGVSPEGPASRWLVQHHLLAVAANWTYNTSQTCVTTVVVCWLWWRHRDAWRELRWVLLGTNLLAVLVFWLYPVAPPRLVPGSGVADTIAAVPVPFGWGPGVQPGEPNQFQALPSLHLAWSTWVAIVFWRVSRHRVAVVLSAGYPPLVGLVVVATGAHSIVDVVAGAATTAVLAVSVLTLPRRQAPPLPYPDDSRDGISAWTSASSPNRSRARPMTTS